MLVHNYFWGRRIPVPDSFPTVSFLDGRSDPHHPGASGEPKNLNKISDSPRTRYLSHLKDNEGRRVVLRDVQD